MITFSFVARLYSMITGHEFSSMPKVSIRPRCFLPVECSLASKRMPSITSRFRSTTCWRDFSTAAARPGTSVAG